MSIADYSQAIYKCLDDIRTMLAQRQKKYAYYLASQPLTISTTPTSLYQAFIQTNTMPPNGYVCKINIRVRAMGTATYIGIGDSRNQDGRLTTAGSTLTIEAPLTYSLDLKSVYAVCDAGVTTVLEISGIYYDINETGRSQVPNTAL